MIGNRRVAIAFAMVFAAFGLFGATPAAAQATRTWVSGVGDDVNPCSRTAPCKTFAGAISKTAPGGEINCLDPGGFGAVTIIKSITINCLYTEGGALAGGNGVVVNAQPTDVVYLRGLDIFGVNPPSNGVRVVAGGAVYIENSVIRRFNAANSAGVSFAPTGATLLVIRDTTIADNGNAATGGGIVIRPTGTGSARVFLERVNVVNNANIGLSSDTSGTTGAAGITIVVDDSNFVGNATGISALRTGGTSSAGMTITGSNITSNSVVGIVANGGQNFVRVRDSIITGNTLGLQQLNGGSINSFGNNVLTGNPTVGAANNGAFTGADLLED